MADPAAQNEPQTVTIQIVVCEAVDNVKYVIQYGPNDPGLFNPAVSDPLEDGSVDHPFDTIQKGIDAAIEGQRVVVFPGTYDEYVSFNGKNIVLTSVNPVDPEIVNATIICDGSRYDAVTFSGSEGPDASLRGLTIMSRGIGSLDLGIGSRGIYGSGTLATIEHCVITGFRKESVSGGGILGCNGLISHCTISNNTAYAFGGLFRCDGSITNCTISDNTAYARGGGLGFCHGLIENCMITGNMVTGYRYYSDFGFGGGLFNCDGSIMNCTIADNTAYKSGGGLDECNGSIMNCIIWNNTAVISGDQLYESSTPTYSCIQDWAGGGMGNINADPLFVDPVDDWFEGDYHLKSEGWRWDAVAGEWTWDDETSPCVDSGNPGMLLGDELITLDVDPLNRWGENIRINMGVYGGTPEASMAPPGWALLCDLDNSGNVNLSDFAPLAAAWMQTAQNQPPDVTRDGTVDLGDLITLTDDWLSN